MMPRSDLIVDCRQTGDTLVDILRLRFLWCATLVPLMLFGCGLRPPPPELQADQARPVFRQIVTYANKQLQSGGQIPADWKQVEPYVFVQSEFHSAADFQWQLSSADGSEVDRGWIIAQGKGVVPSIRYDVASGEYAYIYSDGTTKDAGNHR